MSGQNTKTPDVHEQTKRVGDAAARIIAYPMLLLHCNDLEGLHKPSDNYLKEVPDVIAGAIRELDLSDARIALLNQAFFPGSSFQRDFDLVSTCLGIYRYLEESGELARMLNLIQIKIDPGKADAHIRKLEQKVAGLQAQLGISNDPTGQADSDLNKQNKTVDGGDETEDPLIEILCTVTDSVDNGLSRETATLLRKEGMHYLLDIVQGTEREISGILRNSPNMLSEVKVMLKQRDLHIGMSLDQSVIEAVKSKVPDIPF